MKRIKVDTEAIARNGKRRDLFEPTIVIGYYNDRGELLYTAKARGVVIDGPCRIIQDDFQPGFKTADGRRARVWIETEAEVVILNPF